MGLPLTPNPLPQRGRGDKNIGSLALQSIKSGGLKKARSTGKIVMRSLLRDEILRTADVIVVKVGTNVLTHATGLLNEERIARMTEDLSGMIARKKKVVLVSSGAVGAGMGRLGLTQRPVELAQLQATAAIGQGKLIETYERYLVRFGVHPAQILLTADDLSNRQRYLNTRNTLRALFDYGALPIINENDTVSVSELYTTFGDNDRLASLVANLFESPLLILLTDVDGLFDRNPADPAAQLIPIVKHWSSDLIKMVAENDGIHRMRRKELIDFHRIFRGSKFDDDMNRNMYEYLINNAIFACPDNMTDFSVKM